MTAQTGQQIITIHILHNESRNKDNQAIKSGHSVKYGERNLFLQKSCKK